MSDSDNVWSLHSADCNEREGAVIGIDLGELRRRICICVIVMLLPVISRNFELLYCYLAYNKE
jgi:hypothetical protein